MNKKDRIQDKVIEIVQEQSGLVKDSIFLHSNMKDDLGMDSLDNVEMVMACEEAFCIEISDEQAEKCKTVKDCVDLIGRLV